MIYTKTYKQQAMAALVKLDAELGRVEGALDDLLFLSKDTVKGVKVDSEIQEIMDNMSITLSDLYTYKNKLVTEIEKANEK